MPTRSLLLWLAALVALSGCTSVERARQCQKLAEGVNPRLGTVAQLVASPQEAPILRAVAANYDGIADDLGPLEFQSQALAKAVQTYGKQLRELAAEARKAADAFESKDQRAYQKARREVRSLSGKLATAQQRIDAACR